jgi:hypothetical protein
MATRQLASPASAQSFMRVHDYPRPSAASFLAALGPRRPKLDFVARLATWYWDSLCSTE